MRIRTKRQFLLYLLAVLGGAFGIAGLVICVLYAVASLQAQRDPGIAIQSMTVDQADVSLTHQLMIKTRVSVRKGCVGKFARGYVRSTPGVLGSIDIQLVTDAAAPIGFDLADLGVKAPAITSTPSPVDATHKTITYREFIPSPNSLESGGGWRIAEMLSQESCGWLHGLLPINTTVVLGPPINLSGDN